MMEVFNYNSMWLLYFADMTLLEFGYSCQNQGKFVEKQNFVNYESENRIKIYKINIDLILNLIMLEL